MLTLPLPTRLVAAATEPESYDSVCRCVCFRGCLEVVRATDNRRPLRGCTHVQLGLACLGGGQLEVRKSSRNQTTVLIAPVQMRTTDCETADPASVERSELADPESSPDIGRRRQQEQYSEDLDDRRLLSRHQRGPSSDAATPPHDEHVSSTPAGI